MMVALGLDILGVGDSPKSEAEEPLLSSSSYDLLPDSYTLCSSDDSPFSEQGKVAELRQELLNGGKKDKNHTAKKTALKKIVANMTMSNNDMVLLFPDVVDCMSIQNLEIKKM